MVAKSCENPFCADQRDMFTCMIRSFVNYVIKYNIYEMLSRNFPLLFLVIFFFKSEKVFLVLLLLIAVFFAFTFIVSDSKL
jgi:hypothetical protein